jgi:hypothetical protein
MATLEKRASALEPAPTAERAIMLAQAANAATDGIWGEFKEFRTETRTRFDTIEGIQREHGIRLQNIDNRLDTIDNRLDTMEESHREFQTETRARFDRLEETQRLSNSMLQLILDEVRKR